MRRVFIIRKDLHLKPGKLAAMVGHCCEAYWTNLMKSGGIIDNEFMVLPAINPMDSTQHYYYKQPNLNALSEQAFKDGQTSFTCLTENPRKTMTISIVVPKEIWNDYVNGIFTKTICEARNINQLKKAEDIAKELKLVKDVDYGYINDKCLTDLVPENPDGTCTVGIWFKPLLDDIAHQISKKFPLYKD